MSMSQLPRAPPACASSILVGPDTLPKWSRWKLALVTHCLMAGLYDCAEAGTEPQSFGLSMALLACRPMKNSLGRDGIKELVKVVVSAKNDRVLGFHMVGSEASEIMQACICLYINYTLHLSLAFTSVPWADRALSCDSQ